MKERYDSILDMEYLSGILKEQFKIISCRFCYVGWIFDLNKILWKDRFNYHLIDCWNKESNIPYDSIRLLPRGFVNLKLEPYEDSINLY